MQEQIVTTRPERTSDQIVEDRKEATAFFERLTSMRVRDLNRIINYEVHDYKLLMADQEGKTWASKNNRTRVQRDAQRAKVAAQNPLNFRNDDNLRPYLSPSTRKMLPHPRLHKTTRKERQVSQYSRQLWCTKTTRGLTNYFQTRVANEGKIIFEHWLLENPGYGPLSEEVELFTKPKFNPAKTTPGKFNPAGTTPERALQIAVAVLNKKGSW